MLNRLTKLFENNRENLLTVYFTAGYPKLDDTETIICSLAESGANIIEIGIPYSDPLADGPVIQESGMAAIDNGMTLQVLFNQLTDIRTKTQVPLILMGYFNQLLQYGVDKFLDDCVKTGIDGLIIPDLPLMEYEQFYKDKLTQRNISISFLITPQTEESRIHKVDALSTGFIYVVSDSSITGMKTGISNQQISYFERIKSLQLRTPQLIGFGISDRESYLTASKYANGAIIGSAFIKHLKDKNEVDNATADFINLILKP
ncbi:MAG: tryptophan synthase subunit alpha [Saprospiraceae bacterium]|nr:tryptophan synthase subunit alpha [Saprospiraceae bacterium]MDP5089959.1 tryptophan synthase subunit alpha [Saprospiraceae bacterium]